MGWKHTNHRRARATGAGDIRDAGKAAAAKISGGIGDASEMVHAVGEGVRAIAGKGANGVRGAGDAVREAPTTGAQAAADAKDAVAEQVHGGVVAVRGHRGRFVTIAAAVSACLAAIAGLIVRRSRSNPV